MEWEWPTMLSSKKKWTSWRPKTCKWSLLWPTIKLKTTNIIRLSKQPCPCHEHQQKRRTIWLCKGNSGLHSQQVKLNNLQLCGSDWKTVWDRTSTHRHLLSSIQQEIMESASDEEFHCLMDQKESPRQQSTTRSVIMPADRVAMMFQRSMQATTAWRRRQVMLTITWVTTWHQEPVSKIRSSRNGPDGVGGYSWKANLQTIEVD